MERVISKDIVLKNLKVSDAFALFNAVESSRGNLSKYMPWEKSVVDLESARAYIEGRLNSGIEGSQWYRRLTVVRSTLQKTVFRRIWCKVNSPRDSSLRIRLLAC